ncbi:MULTISPECIES: MauE/DoxX family redox-associated membrane protein [Lysinibacillus]|uniref:MauE/DoxX family redox-associated membrane protein n=1 Tax=Lysinibacillus TaxID=400634 RepID=UPI00257C6249|nr:MULTISPECIES: MauE/DoxX family redox-associated membrane protein [Lysinibacillus]
MEEALNILFQYFIRILSIVAAVIYFKSSIGKFKDIYAFKVVIEDYKIFPNFLVPLIAVTVPALEITVVIALLIGGSNIFSAALVGALMQMGFAILMILKLNKVQPNGCGCFGLHSAEKITMKHVLRNFGMFIMFLLILSFPNTQLI